MLRLNNNTIKYIGYIKDSYQFVLTYEDDRVYIYSPRFVDESTFDSMVSEFVSGDSSERDGVITKRISQIFADANSSNDESSDDGNPKREYFHPIPVRIDGVDFTHIEESQWKGSLDETIVFVQDSFNKLNVRGFTDLPIGSRFSYIKNGFAGENIYVVIEHYGSSKLGTVAEWQGINSEGNLLMTAVSEGCDPDDLYVHSRD